MTDLRELPESRAALAATLLLATGLVGQADGKAQDRERAVLEVLRDATAGSRYGAFYWELRSVPDPASPQGAPPKPLPRRAGLCGNSISGWVDEAELRGYTARLFRAFDLEPAADLGSGIDGVPTVFEVGSAGAKVAVKLDGRARPTPAGPEVTFPEMPVDEPAGPTTPEQLAQLEAAGWRVLHVRLAEFALLHDDRVQALLPFLGRVVELLNAATSGADVDVAPLVRGWEQRWNLPPLERTPLPRGIRRTPVESTFEVTATARLSWQVTGAVAVRNHPEQNQWRSLPASGSTAGQLTIVALRVTAAAPAAGKGSGLLLRLVQGSLSLSSTTPQLLVPASFDASRPFTLTAEFAPGSYQVFPQVSAAALR
jgi:hypothetical protein